MPTNADDRTEDVHDLLLKGPGDRAALFAWHGTRLKEIVRARLDPRARGRIDPDDVLQDVYLDFERRWPEFAADPGVPFFLWLRGLALQRLTDLHRAHLGARMRDAGRERSIDAGRPDASSAALAELLVGRFTSASRAAERVEAQNAVQAALAELDPIDREILTLRHFELLSNGETAQVLGLAKTAASNRYVRALKRLKSALE